MKTDKSLDKIKNKQLVEQANPWRTLVLIRSARGIFILIIIYIIATLSASEKAVLRKYLSFKQSDEDKQISQSSAKNNDTSNNLLLILACLAVVLNLILLSGFLPRCINKKHPRSNQSKNTSSLQSKKNNIATSALATIKPCQSSQMMTQQVIPDTQTGLVSAEQIAQIKRDLSDIKDKHQALLANFTAKPDLPQYALKSVLQGWKITLENNIKNLEEKIQENFVALDEAAYKRLLGQVHKWESHITNAEIALNNNTEIKSAIKSRHRVSLYRDRRNNNAPKSASPRFPDSVSPP